MLLATTAVPVSFNRPHTLADALITLVIFVIAMTAFVFWPLSRASDPSPDGSPRRRKRRHRRHDELAGFSKASSEGKQIVGVACAECTQKIAFDEDGRWCDDCGNAFHVKDCARQHRLTVHRPHEHTGAYR